VGLLRLGRISLPTSISAAVRITARHPVGRYLYEGFLRGKENGPARSAPTRPARDRPSGAEGRRSRLGVRTLSPLEIRPPRKGSVSSTSVQLDFLSPSSTTPRPHSRAIARRCPALPTPCRLESTGRNRACGCGARSCAEGSSRRSRDTAGGMCRSTPRSSLRFAGTAKRRSGRATRTSCSHRSAGRR
jgi:hypothetical protein